MSTTRRRRAAFPWALLVLASHCGGGGPAGDGGRDGDGGPAACLPPLELTGTTPWSTLFSGRWPLLAPYAAGWLPVTPDLLARGELRLDGGLIPAIAWCAEGSWCRFAAGFQMPVPVAGVSLEGVGPPTPVPVHRWLVATDGARFRLRAVSLDARPPPAQPMPVLLVLPPCSDPCAEGTQRCVEDRVCYAPGGETCRFCQVQALSRCACAQAAGVAPDGTPCVVPIAVDRSLAGTCLGGSCRVSR